MQQVRLAVVAVALCVTLRTSEAILPIAASCCTEVSHHLSRRLLERVTACHIQRADGDCDLAAVILHVKRRRICISPHNPTVKQWIKTYTAEKNGKGNSCQKKKRHSKRKNRPSPGKPRETHSRETPQ
ncbi:C-C motif chemokine 28 [Octodon degus]|uniref:C-C motif chemokine 28 n=1 Tax=Octodon degus TaxID=10160 RepID=A0A6P6DTI5_OCTDE|nr:C-C motif chemokine 28 [Octodon degus]XP_023563338.1 C-C motif chemokine 28 [Octodon degus]